MPTYEYRCDQCARNFDVVQSFQDDPLTECPTCGNPVRKVFGSVGIVFKGSGFYKTDSRSGSGSASRTGDATTPAAAAADATPATSGAAKESSTADKATDKPAAPAGSPKVPTGSSSTSGGSSSGSSTAAPA